MNVKSIGRTFLRLGGGIIVVCLSFAAIAGATTLADGTPITAEQATCWVGSPAAPGTQEITFSDVTDQEGITDQVTKDRSGHGVAWGDVNNDGSLDLVLGTFANYDPLVKQGYTSGTFKPDQLDIRSASGFTIDPTFPKTFGWTSVLALADLDKDGRLDIFYDYFFNNVDGQLLPRNETLSGHWLSLSLGRALIGQREISATDGYKAGVPDEAHFGLGTNTTVDVRGILPPDSRALVTNGVIDLTDVPADRQLRLPNGCGGP